MSWTPVEISHPNGLCDVWVYNVKGWMDIERAIYYPDREAFILFNPESSRKYTLEVSHWIQVPDRPKKFDPKDCEP